MINKPGLLRIIGDLQRGIMPLPGEITILLDAVNLLDELAYTLDKIGIPGPHTSWGYDVETTQQLKIIEQGDDDHRGNRP